MLHYRSRERDVRSDKAPLYCPLLEVLLLPGLQTLEVLAEQAYPLEAAYHEEDNFGISC